MVEPSDLGEVHNLAHCRRLDGSLKRRVLRQLQVGSRRVVVAEVA